MTNYCTIPQYIESAADIKEEIAMYKAIITALQAGLSSFVATAGVQKHKLDDTQVIIETEYRSMSEYIAGIKAIRGEINMLRGKLTSNFAYLRNRTSFNRH